MRPYLALSVVLLITVAALGQQVQFPPRVYGPCIFGCGPFVPLVTTPSISLQQVSPNPVGASNATTGLVAGATDSTLSEISGNTTSVYTDPVWYQGGGAPLTSSAVHLWPEPLVHSMRAMHEERMEMERGKKEDVRSGWIYYGGLERTISPTGASTTAKGGKKASRTYTNEDVERQNQKNGNVKYDGKTEKL